MSTLPSPVPLASQVGGHPGVLTIEDGSLLIKPAAPLEVAFFQTLSSDPALAPLRPFIPRFYGTLRLEGRVDTQAARTDIGAITAVEGVPDGERDSLVLENLAHPFLRPNILDAKLGTLLYDEDAAPEKRARMEHAARATTSGATGVRLTGFQVYDLAADTALVTPKAYGRALAPADLPAGLARFFPLAPDTPPAPAAAAPPRGDGTPGAGTGLPAALLAPLLEHLREDVAEIRAALADAPVRMVGASLLVVYEADWARAREGLRLLDELARRAEEDGGAVQEEDDGSGEEDDEDGGGGAAVGLPYAVKLIDFAHTRIVRRGDRDTGVLRGLDTLLGLLDGRIEQIRARASV